MKRDWTSRSTILLVGLILVVINLIGLNLFGRVDLTDDSVYSLSDASIDLVEELNDPVTITAYFTNDLPAPYSGNRRFLKDKLDDYRAYGGQNLQYRFVDPADDEDLRAETQRLGIPPVQIQVIESDNVQLKNAYMGVAIEYGGERETVPVVQDLSTLEYDITSGIRRLTRENLPTVGFLTGHGEPSIATDMSNLQRSLVRNYSVQEVSIVGGFLSEIPDVLMVVAPADSVSQDDLRAIDAFVMQGGKLGLLLNRVDADLQTGQASGVESGFEELLTPYGLGVSENLVMDQQSSAVTVQRQQGFFNIQQQIEYPFFPIATAFNPDNMMVNRLREVLFYFVSTIDTTLALPESVTFEPLVYSSPRSSLQQGFYFVQPMMQQAELSGGPYVLAAAYSGSFPSAFEPGQSSVDTRIALVGDGDMLNESIIGAMQGNVSFGLRMIDWLAQDEALLSIRAKTIEARILDPVSDGARPWIKYGTMLGPVLLIVLFGLVRWQRRRNRRYLILR